MFTRANSLLALAFWIVVMLAGEARAEFYGFKNDELPPGTELLGQATLVNEQLRLTEPAQFQIGSFVAPRDDLEPIRGFTVGWQQTINGSPGNAADGISFNLGELPGGPLGEGGVDDDPLNTKIVRGLALSFDPFHWANELFSGGLEVVYDGSSVAQVPLDLVPSELVPVLVNLDGRGLDVTYNGVMVVEDLDLNGEFNPGVADFVAGDDFAWGGRTGGLVAEQIVDEISLSVTFVPEPSAAAGLVGVGLLLFRRRVRRVVA